MSSLQFFKLEHDFVPLVFKSVPLVLNPRDFLPSLVGPLLLLLFELKRALQVVLLLSYVLLLPDFSFLVQNVVLQFLHFVNQAILFDPHSFPLERQVLELFLGLLFHVAERSSVKVLHCSDYFLFFSLSPHFALLFVLKLFQEHHHVLVHFLFVAHEIKVVVFENLELLQNLSLLIGALALYGTGTERSLESFAIAPLQVFVRIVSSKVQAVISRGDLLP